MGEITYYLLIFITSVRYETKKITTDYHWFMSHKLLKMMI